jgi:predicted DNA-binding transcriptional regulator YafY
MGRRSGAETPAGIMLAFFRCHRWRQAELARELGVTVETLVRSLRVLSDQGMDLTRDDSDKPHIWWRVPKNWAPSGVLFAREETPSLLRALARSPRTTERDALLAHAARSARVGDGAASQVEALSFSDIERSWLSTVEDAAERRVALRMRYYTARGGKSEWRHASVEHVIVGPPARFVALCHRSGTLKWFRVENLSHAKLDPDTPYREHDPIEVRRFVRESVDGFHGEGAPVECAFVVREPEARWVRTSLLSGMTIDPDEEVSDGVRVRCSTAGVLRVARFVVSLGGAATVETRELAACVREIAKGVLEGVAAGEVRDERRTKRLVEPRRS